MNRRRFLSLAGRGAAGGSLAAAALGSLPFLGSCDSSSDKQEGEPVTLSFQVYNHTQGHLADFTKGPIASGSNVYLSVTEIVNENAILNVDPARIALRTQSGLVGYSYEGGLNFKAPSQDKSYEIFLLNSAGTPLYQWSDAQRWPIKVMGPHFNIVFRKDFDDQVGEERVWGGELLPETLSFGVFDQFNSVLMPPWAPYNFGGFDRQPNATSGGFSYGFGNSNGHDYWPYPPTVNANRVPDVAGQVGRGLAVVLERVVGWESIGGQPTDLTIQTGGVLHQAGKDLIAFCYVTS